MKRAAGVGRDPVPVVEHLKNEYSIGNPIATTRFSKHGVQMLCLDRKTLITCRNEGNKKARTKPRFFNVRVTDQAENDEPQPQVVVAFGFLITNCAPSRSSL